MFAQKIGCSVFWNSFIPLNQTAAFVTAVRGNSLCDFSLPTADVTKHLIGQIVQGNPHKIQSTGLTEYRWYAHKFSHFIG